MNKFLGLLVDPAFHAFVAMWAAVGLGIYLEFKELGEED